VHRLQYIPGFRLRARTVAALEPFPNDQCYGLWRSAESKHRSAAIFAIFPGSCSVGGRVHLPGHALWHAVARRPRSHSASRLPGGAICAAGARHHGQIGPAIRHVFYADHQRHSNSKAGSFPGIRLEVWSGLDGPSPVEVFLTLCRNPARTPCPRSLFPRTAPSPESVAGGVCAPRRGAWLSSPLNERCYTESKLL
jgi:hypothetical protein